MLTRKITFLLFLVLAQSAFSQQDGYWDKERATTKEIIVSAGEKITVKTEDLPMGTTEIVYRITILDENQQMANSLSSLLKAIPDPSGISQGAAGAVFLTSKISGDDKCKYGIFSSNAFAKEYKEKGKTDNACLFQNSPVNKEARRLSIDKSSCLKTGQEYLWFGFESMNWIMKQKIVLEIVPWVDNKLSRGWTLENRQTIIRQIKASDLAKKMLNADDFSLCILEKMQKRYKFQEFQNLLAIEKNKAFKDFGNACLLEKPANKSILTAIRLDAMQYFKNRKYEQAIDLLQTGIMENGNASVLDYNALGQYYLYSKQFDKALKALKEGESKDESELLIQLNMAHVYLLKGDYKKAKEIHKKYRGQNVTPTLSWKARTQFDFDDLRKAGFVSDDFDRILKLLEE
jgi:tetratricopeptide (TPR) repeat protein